MPIKKKPGPKGGFVATYGGKSRTFKTRAAAEKRDAKRDIGKEVLQAIKDMKAGKFGAVHKIDMPAVVEGRVENPRRPVEEKSA